MTQEYEPATAWARRVVSLDQELGELTERIRTLAEQRREVMRGRCRGRDSGGARCTGDAGHEDGHRWRPEVDVPEPFKLIGSTFRDLDWWDEF